MLQRRLGEQRHRRPSYDRALRNTTLSDREGTSQKKMADRSITKTREKHLRGCQGTQETAIKCTDLVRHQATRMLLKTNIYVTGSHKSFSKQMSMNEANEGRDYSS